MNRTPWAWEELDGDGEAEEVSVPGLVPVHSSDGITTYVSPEAVKRREKRYATTYNQARPELLSSEEQAQLSETIGAPVETWSEAKAAMKARDIRFVEKGDNRDKWERERKEWIADGKPGKQPTPNATVMGQMKSPNIRQLLKEQGHGY
jgi:hypothetical protein